MSQTRFPTRFGKYILLDRLNSGGMAEVYRAKVTGAEQFQRLVAIKCMLPSLIEDEQFITMFVDEAKLAAQLSHANIVQIYELGRIDEQLYISMELIQGRDLRHVIKQMRAAKMPVPVGFAAYVIAKAAEGLDFAHRKIGVDGSPLNLVHRDVSPQNILISYDGEVKVVDFGIAKAKVRDTETRAGVLKGKFAYMAPEQVMGGDIDQRADIFALGSVLYEVMTGEKLFKGESDFSILEKVRQAAVPSIVEQMGDVPPEIDAVLRGAMAKDPAERFEHASDFAEALTPLLIENRSIFGTKQAKEFMQALYADDIEILAEQLKRYAEIGEEDCIESSAQRIKPRDSEVFETAYEDVDDVLADKDVDANAGKVRDEPDTESSGWTEMEDAAAFGKELSVPTEMFEAVPSEPSIKRTKRPVDPRSQPSIGPQPYDETRASSASGLVSSVGQPSSPGLSKPIFNGLVASSVVLLAAVVGVLAYTRYGDSSSLTVDATPPAAPPSRLARPPLTEPDPVPTTSVHVGSGLEGSPADVPAVDSEPPEDVAKAPGDSAGSDDDGEGTATRLGRKKRHAKARARRPKGGKTGYVTIQVKGVKHARVEIDGKDAGYAPLVYHKLRIGKHRVRVTEEGGAKKKVLDIVVEASNRKNAEKMVVDLSR